jgi:hypothetical protein
MGYDEWPNLKERMHEPKIQESIQTFMKAFDDYVQKYKTDNEVCDYEEWVGYRAFYELSILVDDGKVTHPPVPEYAAWLQKKKYEEKICNILPLEKELPEDVLSIIRQYSKPAFVHFREYNEALRIFHLPMFYKQKLKEKINDSAVRDQIKQCVDANEDYEKNSKLYIANETHENARLMDQSYWRACLSRDKFVCLLDDREYRMQDEIDEWVDPPTDHEGDDGYTLQSVYNEDPPQVFEEEEESKKESNE